VNTWSHADTCRSFLSFRSFRSFRSFQLAITHMRTPTVNDSNARNCAQNANALISHVQRTYNAATNMPRKQRDDVTLCVDLSRAAD
jgi:hypothetical protein